MHHKWIHNNSGENKLTGEHWQTVTTKKGRQFFFSEKIEVTPSVAAPGDTHP